MPQRKNCNNMNTALRNKKMACKIARNLFGIPPAEMNEEAGNLRSLFRMNVPLYTPGSPTLLSVPLELFFLQHSDYSGFTVTLPEPFYVNIERSRLEKITCFSAAFLSRPERLQIVQPRQKSMTDIIPEIGVWYFYGSETDMETLFLDKSSELKVLGEIRQDLLVFFAMLCNHLGVSVDYMANYTGIGCSTLIVEQ